MLFFAEIVVFFSERGVFFSCFFLLKPAGRTGIWNNELGLIMSLPLHPCHSINIFLVSQMLKKVTQKSACRNGFFWHGITCFIVFRSLPSPQMDRLVFSWIASKLTGTVIRQYYRNLWHNRTEISLLHIRNWFQIILMSIVVTCYRAVNWLISNNVV